MVNHRNTLESFAVIKEIQDTYGPEACNQYNISHASKAEDVLVVKALADLFGITQLSIVPLFESIDTLEEIETETTKLLQNKAYVQFVQANDGIQRNLLGYSDSGQDGGFLKSQYQIYMAQRKLGKLNKQAREENGIPLTIFKGMGGSTNRGGQFEEDYILTLPEGSNNEDMTTVQGCVRDEKYGTEKLAELSIQQNIAANIRQKIKTVTNSTQDSPTEEQLEILNGFATAFQEELTKLKSGVDGQAETSFLQKFWTKISPLPYFKGFNISSRPTKRNEGAKKPRAISSNFCGMSTGCSPFSLIGMSIVMKQIDNSRKTWLEKLTRSGIQNTMWFQVVLKKLALEVELADTQILRHWESDEEVGGTVKQLAKDVEAARGLLRPFLGVNPLSPAEMAPIEARGLALKTVRALQQYSSQNLTEGDTPQKYRSQDIPEDRQGNTPAIQSAMTALMMLIGGKL